MILEVSVQHLRPGDRVLDNDGVHDFGTIKSVGPNWFRYHNTDFKIPFSGQRFLIERGDILRDLVMVVKS